MPITIDQLIERLNAAKSKIGGDKTVSLWLDIHNHYEFDDSIHKDIERHITGDREGVSFEIYRTDED